MKLPRVPARYDERDQTDTRAAIEQADAQNYKRNRDLDIGENRIILQSPNGSRFAITVSNTGTLSTTAL